MAKIVKITASKSCRIHCEFNVDNTIPDGLARWGFDIKNMKWAKRSMFTDDVNVEHFLDEWDLCSNNARVYISANEDTLYNLRTELEFRALKIP